MIHRMRGGQGRKLRQYMYRCQQGFIRFRPSHLCRTRQNIIASIWLRLDCVKCMHIGRQPAEQPFICHVQTRCIHAEKQICIMPSHGCGYLTNAQVGETTMLVQTHADEARPACVTAQSHRKQLCSHRLEIKAPHEAAEARSAPQRHALMQDSHGNSSYRDHSELHLLSPCALGQ